jgi:hypothetical protein
MSERPITTLQAMILASESARELYDLHDELARAEARVSGDLMIAPTDPRLVAYRVGFADGDEYRFWAEDAHHAVEQAADAEPEQKIVYVRLELQDQSA